ncbi:MAG: pyridoxal-phosphate dependent enzyme [Chloroflexi bacterium]|nr:pyridoxal-phosphate dependent enzyme [Chloroflexota bacterium]MBP7042462.1 pyridoxal-phosphate dependent enzyme [Chloroflexota bacterium]
MPKILQTEREIRPFTRNTPLLPSPYLSQLTGADVWLKLENWQTTGSFKIRGALSKIGRLSAAQRARGIVAASAGNHALGVAYAASVLGGVTADIFVPGTAPQAKIAQLAAYPVALHQVGDTYEAAHQAAAAFAAETGALEISAYDDLDVIAGQASVGLEIFQQRPQVDLLLVPVGGGGLIAGIGSVTAVLSPTCRVVGVQPSASPAALLSLRDGVAYDPFDHEPTLADGLAGGFGAVPFAVAADLIHDVLLSDERTMRRAMFTLLDRHQLVVEASGAIAIAPLLTNQIDIIGLTVVCVLSGGNVDTAVLRDILNEFS